MYDPTAQDAIAPPCFGGRQGNGVAPVAVPLQPFTTRSAARTGAPTGLTSPPTTGRLRPAGSVVRTGPTYCGDRAQVAVISSRRVRRAVTDLLRDATPPDSGIGGGKALL